MAATAPASESPPGSLKCKTWVLKVSIHCEGCKREVKKALQKLEGVYTINVDSQQHKVTVTGNVSSEALLNKLSRIGKHAQLVQENSPVRPKLEMAEKQNVQKALGGESANSNASNRRNTQGTARPPQTALETNHKAANPAKNSNPGGAKVALKTNKTASPAKNNSNPSANKEPKVVPVGSSNRGKGQKGNLQKKDNPAPMSHKQGKGKTPEVEEKEVSPEGKQAQISVTDPVVEEPQEILLSYNSAHHSSGRSPDLYYQYISSQESVNIDELKTEQVLGQHVQEQGQDIRTSSINSFDMFSEENANGCSIM